MRSNVTKARPERHTQQLILRDSNTRFIGKGDLPTYRLDETEIGNIFATVSTVSTISTVSTVSMDATVGSEHETIASSEKGKNNQQAVLYLKSHPWVFHPCRTTSPCSFRLFSRIRQRLPAGKESRRQTSPRTGWHFSVRSSPRSTDGTRGKSPPVCRRNEGTPDRRKGADQSKVQKKACFGQNVVFTAYVPKRTRREREKSPQRLVLKQSTRHGKNNVFVDTVVTPCIAWCVFRPTSYIL